MCLSGRYKKVVVELQQLFKKIFIETFERSAEYLVTFDTAE